MGILFCTPQLLRYTEMHVLDFMISSQTNGARLLRLNPSSAITGCTFPSTLANLSVPQFSLLYSGDNSDGGNSQVN